MKKNKIDMAILQEDELHKYNGGWWKEVALWAYSEWDEICRGFKDGAGGKEYNPRS